MNRPGSLWKSVIAFLSALAVMMGIASVSNAAVDDVSWQPISTLPADSWYSPAMSDAPTLRPNAVGTLVKIADSQMPSGFSGTYGMCIDSRVPSPEQMPDSAYLPPKKLGSIVTLDPDEFKEVGFQRVPFEGQIRDSAIHVTKLALKAWQEKNQDDFADYSVALQYLLSAARTSQLEGGVFMSNGVARASKNLTPEKFKEITGYEQSKFDPTTDTLTFKYVGADIPKAADDEYLTVLEPKAYDEHFTTTSSGKSSFDDDAAPQMVVPIHQPGLQIEESNNFTPRIDTSVSPKSAVLKYGVTLTDTVSYEGLAPNTQYTLEATLVDKANEQSILGVSESVSFTTPYANKDELSVSGTVNVPITVTANNAEIAALDAAVVFEELFSEVVDRQGNPLTKPSKTRIDYHKDIADEAQTVTNEKEPKLELKKYLSADPEASNSADSWFDAQDEESPVEVGGDAMSIKYSVKNTGNVELQDVEINDHVTGGQSIAEIQKAINAELFSVLPFDLAVGQARFVVIHVPGLDYGAEDHRDEASATASYVSEGGESELVVSNTDEANAVSKPAPNFAPSLETSASPKTLTDRVTEVTDTVTVSGLVEGASYQLLGELYAKGEDGSQGVLLGKTDTPLMFVADEAGLQNFRKAADGSVSGTVEVKVPGADKVEAGQSAVVFETLSSDEVNPDGSRNSDGFTQTIAEHKDINDEAQTVRGDVPKENQFSPQIVTSLNPKSALLESGMTITDTVSFEGLAPNTEYTFNATLVDQADGQKVLGKSEPVTFTTGAANQSDGSVKGTKEVPITVTATDEQLKSVKAAIAFEELTSTEVDKQGNPLDTPVETLIAEYKDIDGDAQGITNTYKDDSVIHTSSGDQIDTKISTTADQCAERQHSVTGENYWPQDCNIIVSDPSISAYSAPEVRREGVERLLEVINEAAEQKVVEYEVEPERNFVRIVVHPDYDLGSHGDRFSDIQKVLRQYGFTEIEVIA